MQVKNPSFDAEVLLTLRRAQIRKVEESAAASGSMSVMARIRFEKFRVRAEEFTLSARREQVPGQSCQCGLVGMTW